jgi:serine/threonine protein kinase
MNEMIVADFVRDMEGADHPQQVLSHYCQRHPHLADELRQLADAQEILIGSLAIQGPKTSLPDRLGDFRITQRIAHGGMGEIYEAVQAPFDRRVAIKTIRGGDRHRHGDLYARFLREQAVLARLHHTHIVPIYAAGEVGHLQYFAMPFIPGEPLHRVIGMARHVALGEPDREIPALPDLVRLVSVTSRVSLEAESPEAPRRPPVTSREYIRSSVRIIRDIAEALQHVHGQGIIHCDLKPSNIMLEQSGKPWLIDFGLARSVSESPTADPRPYPRFPTATGVAGTPSYMAPEQFSNQPDARTDVWGLGVTLYELLTLRPAIGRRARIDTLRPVSADVSPRPRKLNPLIPHGLEAIVLKTLEPDPHRRYGSAAGLADDLGRFLENRPIRASSAWSRNWHAMNGAVRHLWKAVRRFGHRAGSPGDPSSRTRPLVARCVIDAFDGARARCLVDIAGATLPVDFPSKPLHQLGLREGMHFHWRMSDDGAVRDADISHVPTPEPSEEEQQAVESLYREAITDPAEDVWGRFSRS